jgi:tetratricopeptide (TPR) repeat protein
VAIGPYEVLGELGRGGMGVVYRVRAPDGREAALKLLVKADPDAIARFERERRLLASLGEDEGFVGLLDAGTSPEGTWLVMPLVPGGTLRRRLEAGALGVEETVALGVDLARALGRAHARGIVHRDVKPENVLFTAAGRPLLADLGLAKHFDPAASGASRSVLLTKRGAFKGTAAYMASEQIEDASRTGPPADVFALGAVLHECLAGRPAFRGGTVLEVFARVASGTVEPIGRSDVPPWLEAILRRALAREPSARFADGAALAGALAGRESGAATQVVLEERPRRAFLLPVLAGVAVAGVALAAVAARPARVETGGPTKNPPTMTPGPPATPGAVRSPMARALAVLAAGKMDRGDLEGAIADFGKAIELDPGLADARAGRGFARMHNRDLDGAISDFSKAIELDPERATTWGNRGLARQQRGDLEGAIADCTRAIELAPEVAAAWMCRGSQRNNKDDRDGAIADCTRAIELDPKLADAWRVRGAARTRKGELSDAIADLGRSIELAPAVAETWATRGIARVKAADLEGAVADCTRAIELDPELALAWESRGLARGKQGDVDEAIADCTRAVELNPARGYTWEIRGAARLKKEDLDGAIADATRAIELDPRLPGPRVVRGLARKEKGDAEGAVSDLERFLEVAPDDPRAPKVRATLDEAKARRPR